MSHDEANGAVLLEEDGASPPSPSPQQRPNRGVRNLFFSGSPEEELPPIPQSVTDEELRDLSSGDGSASGSEWPSVGHDDLEESSPTSSPDSSADGGGPLKPLTKAALKATTAQAVLIGSAMAHRVAARTEGQKMVGLYIADEEDADNIAGPVASILHRHGGIAGGKISPDANDALQGLLGFAGYISKQVVKLTQAREVDGHLAAGGTLPTEAA